MNLPEDFRFDTNEVYIEKQGDRLILSPRPLSWDDFFASSLHPSDDFMQERVDLPVQERDLC